MTDDSTLRAQFHHAMADATPGLSTADRLCRACVELLDVDGAAVSVTHDGTTRGTFGSSGELSRELDEYQFTFGEGPCLDAVRELRPILVPDLRDPVEQRWPVYAGAVLDRGIRAVFALPVTVVFNQLGSLDLYRHEPGRLAPSVLAGALAAAELAALPLLDLMGAEVDWADVGEDGGEWSELASLERVEVYQATGMVMAQLGVGPTEALARVRAEAFIQGTTASELAWSIIERRRLIEADGEGPVPGSERRRGDDGRQP